MPYEYNQKLPISVSYACSDSLLEDSFRRMFSIWNFACDNIFSLTKSTQPTIQIDYGILSTPAWTAQTFPLGDHAKILIRNPPIRLDITMLHEIGHALGLDHSSEPYSIMNPVVIDDSALLQYDVDTIRVYYGLPSRTFPWKVTVRGLNLVAEALYGPRAARLNGRTRIYRDRLSIGVNEVFLSWCGIRTHQTIVK